ncbi:MAG: condensation domain-containing protein [Longimicrobiales bacterium]|nr:condensation domain-containing protein [Longimicrobiales bacterium]
MTSGELVQTLIARGVRLRQEGGQLLVDAPTGVLTSTLQAEIRHSRMELLAFLGEVETGRGDRGVPRLVPGGAGEGPWRLSPSQERFWFLDRIDSSGGSYNLPWAFRLEGPLDVPALEASLSAFVARHAILRVRFVQRNGIPIMEANSAKTRGGFDTSVDLSGIEPTQREQEMNRLLAAWSEERFDLEEGGLFRARLVMLGPEDHALFVLSHSVVWDGWSCDVLLQELHRLYPTFTGGEVADDIRPQQPVIEYVDYAAWQRARVESGTLDGDVAYWRDLLDDLPDATDLPTDRPRPPRSFDGGQIDFRLDGEILRRLTEVGREVGATPFMVLLSAYTALLYRYTWQNDFLVMVPVRGRPRPELEGVIGTFTRPLPVRIRVASDLSFQDHLRAVRTQLLASLDHQSAPFESVIAPTGILTGGESVPELYRSVFTYQNAADRPGTMGSVKVRSFRPGHDRAHGDMNLGVMEHRDCLEGTLDYRADLFDPATASRFLHHFHLILREVSEDPECLLGGLLAADEEEEVGTPVRGEVAEIEVSLPTLLEREPGVVRVPGDVALWQPGRVVSWEEMDHRATALAHDLRESGVVPGTPVACLGAADVDGVIAFLGVIRASGTLIPLPAESTASRTRSLLGATEARHIVAPGGISFPDNGRDFTVLGIPEPEVMARSTAPWRRIPGGPEAIDDPSRIVLLDADAQGKPAPVILPGAAVARALRSVTREVGLRSDRTVLVSGSLGRGGTVFQLLAALAAGARVACLPSPSADDEWDVVDVLAEREVDVAFLTTPLAGRLLGTEWPGTPGLTLVCEGPRPSPHVVDALRARVGGLWWLNGYAGGGVWCFLERLDGVADARAGTGLVPPAAGRFVGPDGRSPLAGIPGRLFLERPGAGDGEPPIDTGELGRWIGPEGAVNGTSRIQRIRRLDGRVWSGGSLVDPREQGYALSGFPEVEDACVVPRTAPGGENRLVAYLVVGAGRPTPTTTDIRSRLGEQLPNALLPHLVLRVEELPRKADGTVHRSALPDPFDRGARASTHGIETGSPEERLIASVWTEVLGREATGTDDNFFELGGHSLLLLTVIGRIEERCGIRMDPRVFFFHTLGGVAAALAEAQREVSS